MKKIISILVVFFTLFVNIGSSFAFENTTYTNTEFQIIDNSGVNIGDVETQGVKSWIIKNAMKALSATLRGAGDGIYWTLKNLGFDGRKIRAVVNRKNEIADALDRVADNFDYVGHNVKFVIYQQLQAAGFTADVAWMAASIVETLVF